MGGIAPGKAPLDAGMAFIRAAILVRRHAHDFIALKLGLEGTPDPAIGAGRDHFAIGLAMLKDGLFGQGRGRAGLHTGPARDAFRRQEILVHSGGHLGAKAARLDGQGVGALNLLARPHAARADDAFSGIKIEIGVGDVGLGTEMVFTLIAIAHFAQADFTGAVL